MRELFFETHSTSTDNEAGIASGQLDPPLSALGERQARDLGLRYENVPLAAVWCSDLHRSWQTAAIAFADREVPVLRTPLLREWDYGSVSGHPSDIVEPARANHIEIPFPQGESATMVVARVRRLLDELDAAGHTPALIIGHRGIWYALEHLLCGRALAEVTAAQWKWQPGWKYVR